MNKNQLENATSQTEITVRDLDITAAEYQLHKQTREKYHVGMVIMEGSFSAVKHCSNKQSSKEFLLRVVEKARVFGRDDKILQEVAIMRQLRHDNVLTIVDYWETKEDICMVMEPIEVCQHSHTGGSS